LTRRVKTAEWGRYNQPVDDFLRALYRAGFLSAEEMESRRAAIERLRKGELQPTV
jgi:hypothetical protein